MCAGGEEGSGLSALHAALAFIGALTDDAADGRVLIDPEQGTLKFLLLNPAAHFSQVAQTLLHAAEETLGDSSVSLQPSRQTFLTTAGKCFGYAAPFK